MGQRNRLSWDIPAADSFLLNQAIYRLSDADRLQAHAQRAGRAAGTGADHAQAGAQPVAGRAHEVRAGRRPAAPPAGAVPGRADHRPGYHRPGAHPRFLKEYNRRTGATILLTSHYMADVTALCERIIIIHHGQLKYDGGITDLSRRIAPVKLIGVALRERRDGMRPEPLRHCTGRGEGENGDGKQ
jgi:ABC-2 type transport system ATP-binding protein